MRRLVLPLLLATFACTTAPAPPSYSLSGDRRPAYVGATLCKDCHFSEYQIWSNSPHARAFTVLRKEKQDSPQCLVCHTTGFILRGEKSRKLLGIQCETCHGPGGLYAQAMTHERTHSTETRAQNLRLGLDIPTAETCRPCHGDRCPDGHGGDFNYETARAAIDHTGYLEKRYPGKFLGQ